MDTAFPSVSWDEAALSFLTHVKAVRAKKTVYFYQVQIRYLAIVRSGAERVGSIPWLQRCGRLRTMALKVGVPFAMSYGEPATRSRHST